MRPTWPDAIGLLSDGCPMDDVDSVVDALSAGGIVVIPTDTVYGVAASPGIPGAIDAIFELKARSRAKALPVLGDSIDSLARIANFDDRARTAAAKFWPGPLTLVLPRAPGWTVDLGGDDRATVAVRVPALEVTRALLERSGPLAVTSANPSGEAEARSVDEARARFGDRVAAYLDGGVAQGVPSTVLSLVGEPVMLREGAIRSEDLLGDALAS